MVSAVASRTGAAPLTTTPWGALDPVSEAGASALAAAGTQASELADSAGSERTAVAITPSAGSVRVDEGH